VTLSFFLATLARVLILAIIIRAILSWFPPSWTLAPVSAPQHRRRQCRRHLIDGLGRSDRNRSGSLGRRLTRFFGPVLLPNTRIGRP
jgi:hypothetical protein